MKPKVYIAGPMTGLPDLNFPAFERMAVFLRVSGFGVVSPHEVNPDKEMAWADCMKRDIPVLLECDGIVRLLGWENSKGARLECHIAEMLGFAVYDQTEGGVKQASWQTLSPNEAVKDASVTRGESIRVGQLEAVRIAKRQTG